MAEMEARRIVTWSLCVVVGLFFLASAFPKLSQQAETVGAFEEWGYSPGFLMLIGILEGLGGLLVLVPRTAIYGSALLVVVMAGAIYTHLSSGIGSPLMAIVALVLAALAGWLRRNESIGLGRS